MKNLQNTDPQIYQIIKNEIQRQQEGIELIASENIVSPAVLEAMGSALTNKYAEGYPNKRYYGGNEFIDQAEQLAIDRAKQLFGAEHANVQPHAGSQANLAAYFSILNPGDKILAMDLSSGGHLTHGHPVNFSGKLFEFIHYGVNPETEQLDMNQINDIALQEKPKLILAGASAYPRKIDFQAFAEIAKKIDAYFMVDMAHIAGLIATGLHPDPIPYADITTTTTHKTLRGPRGALTLSKNNDRLKEIYRPTEKKNLAQLIDFSVFPGMQGGPLEHIIAAKAVAFQEALQPEFKDYQTQVLKNAQIMAETFLEAGIKLLSNGTDNHLLLLDVTSLNLTGKQVETALDEVKIYTNKNMIPFDKRSPFNPSGIRLGTPAITSRGIKEPEAKIIAESIIKIMRNINNESIKDEVKNKVKELTDEFKIY